MRSYTPRRASRKRWLSEAPEYILDCFKHSHGYTVFFTGPDFLLNDTFKGTVIPLLDLNDAPDHPQGVSQWGELSAPDTARFRFANGKRRVAWLWLPKNVREHIIKRTS